MTELRTQDPTGGIAAVEAPPVVRPASGHTGAEIEGIDLSHPLSDLQRRVVQEALDRWKVVFFRNQRLDHEAHIAFARQFGDLTYAHPYDERPPDGYPEVYTISAERFAEQYGFEGEAARRLRRRYSRVNEWHTDVTAAVNPPAGSVLRADVVPDYGGDTQFTNLAAAYADLSPPLQELVDGLWAEHRYGAGFLRRGIAPTQILEQRPLVARHPVVRVHPRTGEKALFVNPGFTSRILGLDHEESQRILDLLFERITRPAYTARFRWTPGAVAFWDNRATAHLGPQDLDDLDVDRVMHRVTLIGEVPVCPDGRESELVEGSAFEALPVFR